MKRQQSKNNDRSEPKQESSDQTDMLIPKNDRITARLDIVINILLEILLSNTAYESVSYTDKAVYLQALGLPIDDISKIVGRPSNSVSSRLRESKARKSSKRLQRIQPKSGNDEIANAD